MHLRHIGTTLVVGLLMSLGASPFGYAEAPEKPNVVVILTDDQGYGDTGFNGCEDIPTPGIDRIAESGIRFTDGYVSHPFCSPSRAGLLTGRYQHRFGHERNVIFNPDDPEMGMPVEEVTLADTLGEAGYTSGVIGKWHLGAHDNFHPLNRGFDFFYGFLGGGHLYYPDRLEVTDAGLGEEYRTKLLRNHERVEEEQYLTHAFSREAISFVERHQDEPFFLFLSYNAPHTPMHAPCDAEGDFSHIEDETRRTYAAMLQAVDQGVGKLLEKLAALDLEEETLVFFLSDNGGPQPVNGSDNSPLRGNKASVREGGFRVPFAMRWPGHLPEGETYREPISSLDIYATARELAGAPQPEDKPLDGVNLLPYLRGEKDGAPHETLFWRRGGPDGRFAVRHGDMKLAIPGSGGKQLFNLAEDISESNNLASAKPEVVEALDRLRRQWSEQMMEPQFLGLAQEEQYEQRWREEHGKEE